MIEEKIEKNTMALNQCPVTFCMNVLGGKWKPIILFMVSLGMNRFGVMQRNIVGVSKQMLTKQLRELEDDGVLERKIYPEIPPRVEYFITPKGQTLMPIIKSMKEWGLEHMNQ